MKRRLRINIILWCMRNLFVFLLFTVFKFQLISTGNFDTPVIKGINVFQFKYLNLEKVTFKYFFYLFTNMRRDNFFHHCIHVRKTWRKHHQGKSWKIPSLIGLKMLGRQNTNAITQHAHIFKRVLDVDLNDFPVS